MPQGVEYVPVGPRIRQLREKKGWSLTELAERAGISRSYLSQVERGESEPTQGKIVRLADALGALPSELYGEETAMLNISPSLREFAHQHNLGTAEVQMLAQIEYRGKRPSTVEEWKAIFSIIKGMLTENE